MREMLRRADNWLEARGLGWIWWAVAGMLAIAAFAISFAIASRSYNAPFAYRPIPVDVGEKATLWNSYRRSWAIIFSFSTFSAMSTLCLFECLLCLVKMKIKKV